MKPRVIKKEVNEAYQKKIRVGYCDLQDLLFCEPEKAYVTRLEGWACDIYEFGDTAIITGYAPFGNIKASYEVCKKYNDAARKIRCSLLTYEEQKVELRKLIDEFITEAVTMSSA